MTRKMHKEMITLAAEKGLFKDRKTGKLYSISEEDQELAKNTLKLMVIKDTWLKKRFDFLKKHTKGRSKRLVNPFAGKNKAQRQRIISGMQGMKSTQKESFFFKA